jgi:hypothetical protein
MIILLVTGVRAPYGLAGQATVTLNFLTAPPSIYPIPFIPVFGCKGAGRIGVAIARAWNERPLLHYGFEATDE